MGVAFFDFDKTLIRRNSATVWLRREFEQGNVRLVDAGRAAGWLLRYRLGYVGLETGLRIAIGSLEGQVETDLRERVGHFYRRHIRELYRQRALLRVEHHRERGDRIVLLTSASLYLSEFVHAELQFDDLLCTRFEVDPDGRFTGKPIEPLCYGSGKRILAARWLEENGCTWQQSTFYTDSMADISVLEAVAQPVVVNPDPRLARVARRNGWPIEDWNGSESPRVGL